MITSNHRFSFVVSSYNYETYLETCLNSLVHQTYDPSHFEIVVVDDGSTDNSWALIQRFKKQFPSIVPIRQENAGLEKACNAGVKVAKNPYIVRVDADDIVDTNLLSVMNAAMLQQPGFDFYYCKEFFEFYSEKENYAKLLPQFNAEEVFHRGDFFATATVYKKSDLMEVGLFPESVKNCGLENYSVVLTLVSKGKVGLAVPGTYFKYRRHHQNMSTVKRQAIIAYGKTLLAGFGRPFVTNENHPYGLKLDQAGVEI